MRVWRVGTFSMGSSLLFLGLILLFSRLLGLELYQVMISWWPIILVVLGIEILVFLFLSKQEKPVLKYDFLSIFFIGILGMVGIGFAILSSTGIMEKVSDVLERQEQTVELPSFSQKIDDTIKRIVIKTENYPITIEGTPGKEVSLFGTYRTALRENEKLIEQPENFLSVNQTGDTLYVDVKGLPSQVGPFDFYATVSATLLVPSDVKLEVIGQGNNIRLKPRMLLSDWSVDSASEVTVNVDKDHDLTVSATEVQEVTGQDGIWKITEKTPKIEEEYAEGPSGIKSATYQSGKGTHQIQILNAYRVSLITN